MATDFVPFPNGVLIRPHDHFRENAFGVMTSDFTNPQFNFSVSGEVVAVCDRLAYHGRWLRRNKAKFLRYVYDHHEAELRYKESAQYDVPIEIEAGDTVLFPYFYHIAAAGTDHEIVGDCVLIPYDMLYARVEHGELYPLNGNLLARQRQKEYVVDVSGLKKSDRSDTFVIENEGCLVRDYLDYGYPDRKGTLLGKTVEIMHNMAVQIEAPAQNRFSGGDAPLCAFHRRHIIGFRT